MPKGRATTRTRQGEGTSARQKEGEKSPEKRRFSSAPCPDPRSFAGMSFEENLELLAIELSSRARK
jgi:hypothetical protein